VRDGITLEMPIGRKWIHLSGEQAIITVSVQSGLNISESVILTNLNNDTDLVGTNFFSVILIRYSRKFVFRLRHNKTGKPKVLFSTQSVPFTLTLGQACVVVAQIAPSDCSIVLHFRT